ncbi:MAG: DUF4469 domain-containing protein, partial [Spirochaetaceae bacterium]|nr:DUF4469 domain-containing protein [Spirochaetaceae bacterium]
MSVIDDAMQVLHKIRVKLYPDHLPGKDGCLIARTANEKTLSYEEVCAAAKERGGYTGSLEDLKEHTAVFLKEAVHQLCDGFGVNFGGLFTAYINVGGMFENEYGTVDKAKHKMDVRFKALYSLRKIVDLIEIFSEGLADTAGYIAEIEDVRTKLLNDVVTIGGMFILLGGKIRVFGEAAAVGVYFCALDTPGLCIKVTENLAANDPSKIIGVVPELPPGHEWYIEVRTYFSGKTGRLLKEMRTIRSTFTVKQ